MDLEIGQRIEVRAKDGYWVMGTLIEIRDEECTVDLTGTRGRYVFARKDVRAEVWPEIMDHPDSRAVDDFARAMKERLYQARLKGRGGWEKPEECAVDLLAKMLMQHTSKGDPVDVANFAMMLFMRKASHDVLGHAAEDWREEGAASLREELEDIKQACIDAGCTDPSGEYSPSAMVFVEELRQRTVCKAPYHPLEDVSREHIEEFCQICVDLEVDQHFRAWPNAKLVWDALTTGGVDPGYGL